jgi:hypothetical protein
MDWVELIGSVVAMLAVIGFSFLERRVSPTEEIASSSVRGPRSMWEVCYRECMDTPSSGDGNQYVFCADECGLHYSREFR